jgi:serine/threonine-protein kinase
MQAAEGDDTVVVAPSSGSAPRTAEPSPPTHGIFGGLDGSSLSTIERSLARHIGPMARIHLRRAMQDARSPDELLRLLSDLLPEGDLRDRFVKDALQVIAMRPEGSLGAMTAQPDLLGLGKKRPAVEAVAIVTRALAHSAGPMARHLVKRALARAATLEELRQLCLEQIDTAGERERFQALLADLRYPGTLAVSVRDLPGGPG